VGREFLKVATAGEILSLRRTRFFGRLLFEKNDIWGQQGSTTRIFKRPRVSPPKTFTGPKGLPP